MVLAPKVDGVHVHAAVIGPVVRQSHNELDVRVQGCVDHLVETRNIDGWLAIIPQLEDNLRGSGAFATVSRKSLRVVRGVLVIEAPGPEDIEPCVLGGSEPLLNIGLVLSQESRVNIILEDYPRAASNQRTEETLTPLNEK